MPNFDLPTAFLIAAIMIFCISAFGIRRDRIRQRQERELQILRATVTALQEMGILSDDMEAAHMPRNIVRDPRVPRGGLSREPL